MIDSTVLDPTTRRSAGPTADEAVRLMTAVGDPVRWTVLRQLSAGRSCVCDLRASVEAAPNLLSYHLKVFRDAGLVTTRRRGRWVDYELAADAAARMAEALPVADVAQR